MSHRVDITRDTMPFGEAAVAKPRIHEDDRAENHDAATHLMRAHEIPIAAVPLGLSVGRAALSFKVIQIHKTSENKVIPSCLVRSDGIVGAAEWAIWPENIEYSVLKGTDAVDDGQYGTTDIN